MKQRPLFERIIIGYWPYWVGGIVLGLLNILITLIYRPWGITGAIANWGFNIWSLLGGSPEKWHSYFQEVGIDQLSQPPLFNKEAVLIIGMVAGVTLAAALAGDFRIKLPKLRSQVIFGIIGGILMGYGARLALGCNIGAMVGGIASQSLHGWVSGLFMFLGALLGSLFIRRYFIR